MVMDIAIKAAFVSPSLRESKCETKCRERKAGLYRGQESHPSMVKNPPGTRVCTLSSSPQARALNASPSKDIIHYWKSTSETINSHLGRKCYWRSTKQFSSKSWQAFLRNRRDRTGKPLSGLLLIKWSMTVVPTFPCVLKISTRERCLGGSVS